MRKAVQDAVKKLYDVGIAIQYFTADNYSDPPNFYDGMEYTFYKIPRKKPNPVPNSLYTYPDFLDFHGFHIASSSANYCCGIPELGNYSLTKSRNTIFTTKNLILCFDLIKVNEDTGYLHLYTTSRAEDRWINNVLPQAGFRKKVTLPSKHGLGRYKVIMWDWLKEYDNES